jgi:hypothetical protein
LLLIPGFRPEQGLRCPANEVCTFIGRARVTLTDAPDRALTESKPGEELEFAPRVFSDQEAAEKLCAYHGWDATDLADGRHRRRLNHELDMYRYHVRKSFACGELAGLEHNAAIAAALWPEQITSKEVLNRKTPQLRRWRLALEEAGLLEIRDARGERGIRWRLLDGRRRYPEALPRGYSSDGRAPGSHPGGRRFDSG